VLTGGSTHVSFLDLTINFAPASGSYNLIDLIGTLDHHHLAIMDMHFNFDAASGSNKIVGRSAGSAKIDRLEMRRNYCAGAALDSLFDAGVNAEVTETEFESNVWKRDAIGGDPVIDFSAITSSNYNLANRIMRNTVSNCTEFYKNPATGGGSSHPEYIVGNFITDSGSGAGDVCIAINGGRDRGGYIAQNRIVNYTGDWAMHVIANQSAASTKPQIIGNSFYDINGGSAIQYHGAHGGTIADNDFTDFGSYGIKLSAGWGGAPGYALVIANNTFYGGTQCTHDTDSSGAHSMCVLTGNTSYNAGGTAFSSNQGDNWAVMGNTAYNPTTYGFTGFTYSQFVGNTVRGAGSHGFNCSTGSSYSGNQATNCGGAGFNVDAARVKLIGNTAGATVGGGNTGDGFSIGNNADNCLIVGNYAYDNGDYGFDESSGADGNSFSDNYSLSNTTGEFRLLGTNHKNVEKFAFSFQNSGAVLNTGNNIAGGAYVPYDCEITSAILLADQSGSVVVDIWVDSYSNYPPTVVDSITAAAKPTLSSAIKGLDSTLTGWTTALSAGDFILPNIDSVSTITELKLILTVERR